VSEGIEHLNSTVIKAFRRQLLYVSQGTQHPLPKRPLYSYYFPGKVRRAENHWKRNEQRYRNEEEMIQVVQRLNTDVEGHARIHNTQDRPQERTEKGVGTLRPTSP
jgi:transcriptional regulator with PAS, ATPase and Fis domain